MLRVVFEPTIPMFETAKAFHAVDSAAIVIGSLHIFRYETGKVHPPYEQRYVIPCIGVLRNGSPVRVHWNSPTSHEYRKYTENRI
jgi:hypothetical protein